MNWYYADNGRQIGPFDEMAFQNLVATGQIGAATLVWNSGMTEWKPASEAGVGVAVAEGQAAPCSECGMTHSTAEMIRFGPDWVCANCKSLVTQKIREGVNLAGAYKYGGFWIRVGAYLIDAILLSIVNFSMNGLVLGWGQAIIQTGDSPRVLPVALFNFGTNVAYYVFLTSHFGGTAGKLALGLRVITREGRNLSILHSVGRFFSQFLNLFTFGIGYAMAGWDDEKRALHDRICNTRVIRK